MLNCEMSKALNYIGVAAAKEDEDEEDEEDEEELDAADEASKSTRDFLKTSDILVAICRRSSKARSNACTGVQLPSV